MFQNKYSRTKWIQHRKQLHLLNGTQIPQKLRIRVPIEKHAKTIYTWDMYEKFYDELFCPEKFAVKDILGDETFIVTDARDLNIDDA